MTAPNASVPLAPNQDDARQSLVAPSLPAQPLQDPREAAKWSRLRFRHFTVSGTGVNIAVGAAATSLAVTFAREEPDTNYGVLITPTWDTTLYVTNKATTGFTANFGTGAPGGGGFIDWATHRSED